MKFGFPWWIRSAKKFTVPARPWNIIFKHEMNIIIVFGVVKSFLIPLTLWKHDHNASRLYLFKSHFLWKILACSNYNFRYAKRLHLKIMSNKTDIPLSLWQSPSSKASMFELFIKVIIRLTISLNISSLKFIIRWRENTYNKNPQQIFTKNSSKVIENSRAKVYLKIFNNKYLHTVTMDDLGFCIHACHNLSTIHQTKNWRIKT